MIQTRAWMKVRQGSVCVEEATTTMIEHEVGAASVGLISILGQTRKGKSLLMSLLSGHPDLFPVSHANEPCTEGIKIATYFKPMLTQATGNKVLIGYVDTEGSGAKGAGYDTKLLVPLLLVSRVVIFNWVGRPAKDEMLQELHHLARAACGIAEEAAEGAQGEDEEATGQRFGTLVILFRDLVDDKGLHDLVLKEERVPRGGCPTIEAHNRIRRDLASFFDEILIFTLPPPVTDINLLSTGRLCPDHLHPAFARKLQQLRDLLEGRARQPLRLHGRPLTGTMVAHLMPRIAAIINSAPQSVLLEPLSLLQQVEQQVAVGAKERALKEAGSRRDAIVARLQEQANLGEPDLEAACVALCDASLALFEAGVQGLLPASAAAEQHDLEGRLGEMKTQLRSEYERARHAAGEAREKAAREQGRMAHEAEMAQLSEAKAKAEDGTEEARKATSAAQREAEVLKAQHEVMLSRIREVEKEKRKGDKYEMITHLGGKLIDLVGECIHRDNREATK